MPLIQWTEDFCLGHQELDAQHKKWVDIYNNAHDRMMDPECGDFASTGIDMLREMLEYSETHFAREEEIMADFGGPELTRHKKIHQAFAGEIKCMIRDMTSGTLVLNSEIIKRIENWLCHHILKEDRVLTKFLVQECDPE